MSVVPKLTGWKGLVVKSQEKKRTACGQEPILNGDLIMAPGEAAMFFISLAKFNTHGMRVVTVAAHSACLYDSRASAEARRTKLRCRKYVPCLLQSDVVLSYLHFSVLN